MSEIPPSAFVPCEIPLPGGVLVLAPLRRFGSAAPETARAGSALHLLRGHPETLARLRRDWLSLDLGGDPYRLSPQQMMSALEAAVAAGRLGAAFFPHVVQPVAVLSADRPPPGPPPAPAPPSVRAMSREQRIEAMLKLVPNHLTGGLKEAFLQLISPTAIGIMVASLVALLVGHAFGYGEIADAALAATAYALAGLAGVAALYNMIAAVWDASQAQTDAELDAAANRFAVALAVLGVTILLFLVSRFRSRSKSAPKEEPKAPPKEDAAPKSPSGGGSSGSGAQPTSPVISPKDVAGKTPQEVDAYAKSRGLVPKGPDPMNGKGAYVDPVTGEQRILSHPSAEGGHLHVNDAAGQRLDINSVPVAPESPAAHLPIGPTNP